MKRFFCVGVLIAVMTMLMGLFTACAPVEDSGSTYSVTFVDYDDRVLKVEDVAKEGTAVAPENPARTNYRFVGWDQEFSCITKDTTVKAQYTRQYEVTFYGANGVVLDRQYIDEGGNAVAPTQIQAEGYTFVSWDKTFTGVQEDIAVRGVYTVNRYTVRFVMPSELGGAVLVEETDVLHGMTVVAPEVEDFFFHWGEHKGYYFTDSWDKVVDDTPITEDTTFIAQYDLIEDPIFVIRSEEVERGTQSVEVRVYLLLNSATTIYGIDCQLSYQSVENDGSNINKLKLQSVTVNDALIQSGPEGEQEIDNDSDQVKWSWISAQGVQANGLFGLLTLNFKLDPEIEGNAYLISELEDIYFIVNKNDGYEKIYPVVLSGAVLVEEAKA